MYGSQLVEKLVMDSKALGSLEYQKDRATETVRRLSDEASGLKWAIANMNREKEKIREKEKLPANQEREAKADLYFQRAAVLTGHQRNLRDRLRSIRQKRRRTLDQKRLIQRQIDLLKARVSFARDKLT